MAQVAIILHGPPGTGKSAISDEIAKRTTGTKRISLDDGWAMHERPAKPLAARYDDIRQAKEPILLIELGFGEPANLNSIGATRGAEEWVRVLRDAGRHVFAFLLWMEWSRGSPRGIKSLIAGTIRSSRHSVGSMPLYEHQHPLVTFPAILGLQEVRILTAERTAANVASEIVRRCEL